MRNVPLKNYIYLLLLLVFTILVTLYLSNMYLNKNKDTSDFYKYSNTITTKDFDVYITENPDAIVYLANKYDMSYSDFESKLQSEIELRGIKDKFIYINVNNKFINKLNKEYRIKLSISKLPIIVIFVDGKISDYMYVDNTSSANIIDYKVLE